MHKILVIGQIRFLRDGIAAAMERAYPDVRVRAAAPADASPAAAGADLLVVALDEDAGATLAALRATAPATPILGLVLRAAAVVAAAAHGVTAFVSPSQTLDDVVVAAGRAARGEQICPPAVAATLFEHFSAGRLARGEVALTVRESEVGALMVRGMSNKEIAATLFVEPATVKNHVHAILRKLEVRRRGEAAALLAPPR